MKARVLTLILVAAAVLAATSALPDTARAINPTQTTATGVVNYEFRDLAAFWGGQQPGVRYYNYYANGQLVVYNTPCGSTLNNHGTQGFYCPPSRTIYLDHTQQQGNLNRFGDGAVGFWLAHEYGHHVGTIYSQTRANPNNELLADCFAGMYVRYGVTRSYRLFYNDYLEARKQIWALGWDLTHGTPQQRLNAFDRGYSNGTWAGCITAY